MTIEAVVNQALDLIGYTRHIGNILEGSPMARVALNTWGQTRDSLLSLMEPEWARKDSVLVLAKSAPNIQGASANYNAPWNPLTNPPLPWLYEYTTPTDCIKPLQIKPSEFFLPVWQPRANPFRQIITDTTDTILSNVPDAILIYTSKVLDPDVWHEEFREAMIRTLANKLHSDFAKQAPQQQKGQENADAAS